MWQNWAHCVYSVFPLLRIIDEFWCNARSLLRLPFHQFDSPIINRRQLRRRCAACFFLFHSFQLSSSPYTLNRMAKVVWSGRASNRRMVQGLYMVLLCGWREMQRCIDGERVRAAALKQSLNYFFVCTNREPTLTFQRNDLNCGIWTANGESRAPTTYRQQKNSVRVYRIPQKLNSNCSSFRANTIEPLSQTEKLRRIDKSRDTLCSAPIFVQLFLHHSRCC